MIAVYNCNNSTPYSLFCLKVDDSSYASFQEALQREQYPSPTSEVIFIENDQLVDQRTFK